MEHQRPLIKPHELTPSGQEAGPERTGQYSQHREAGSRSLNCCSGPRTGCSMADAQPAPGGGGERRLGRCLWKPDWPAAPLTPLLTAGSPSAGPLTSLRVPTQYPVWDQSRCLHSLLSPRRSQEWTGLRSRAPIPVIGGQVADPCKTSHRHPRPQGQLSGKMSPLPSGVLGWPPILGAAGGHPPRPGC